MSTTLILSFVGIFFVLTGLAFSVYALFQLEKSIGKYNEFLFLNEQLKNYEISKNES